MQEHITCTQNCRLGDSRLSRRDFFFTYEHASHQVVVKKVTFALAKVRQAELCPDYLSYVVVHYHVLLHVLSHDDTTCRRKATSGPMVASTYVAQLIMRISKLSSNNVLVIAQRLSSNASLSQCYSDS